MERAWARLFLCSAVVVLGACSPMAAPIPFHFAETAETLKAGQVSLTLAGGGGSAGLDGAGGGGAGRVRIGIDGRNEIGMEASMLAVDAGGNTSQSQPWLGTNVAYAGKLSWKLGLKDWVAIIVGLGGSQSPAGPAVGADAAVLFSTRGRIARYFGGLRGTFAGPIGRPFYDNGGPAGGFTVGNGVAFLPSSTIRLFLEGGFAILYSHGYDRTSGSSERTLETSLHAGFYLALGVAFHFGQ
jgi:hypothetical protein